MYSGTTIHGKSGRIMGVHQKIDRVARRYLSSYVTLPKAFPTIREILHFEGLNGPDGIKRKSPGIDEPWHFIDPENPLSSDILVLIKNHLHNLTVALAESNRERAAFEAAWLAHTITDGLTPAHHYPLEEKLSELRSGEDLSTRTSKRKKLIVHGATKRQLMRNNWEFWGAKGVMTNHIHFELGIMTAIAAMKFDTLRVSGYEKNELSTELFIDLFIESVQKIAQLQMYEEFQAKGWTNQLARQSKNDLVPEIIRVVIIGWMTAVVQAEQKA